MEEEDFFPPKEGNDADGLPFSILGKPKESPAASAGKGHLLGPICPICAKALGPSTSNQGLNDHIDWCLNQEAIFAASKQTPKRTRGSGEDDTAKRKPLLQDKAKKKGDEKGSMLGWLTKDV